VKIKENIGEILAKLPAAPGVYLMKDAYGRIVYVGKSKHLKNRVSSYFKGFDSHSPKTQTLVVNIDDIEYIITDTEEEALALESNLIKKHRPKFNVLLKDDKQYPYIMITYEDEFPRVIKTRKVVKDRNKYFGPYSSNFAVNETLETLHRIFPIRKCNRDLSRVKRPCLNYHIDRCLGPCVYGKEVSADYGNLIREIEVFLKGNQKSLLKVLKAQMLEASEALAFEKALELRDKIAVLESLTLEQKVVSARGTDQDLIGLVQGDKEMVVTVFFVRGGRLVDRQHFVLDEGVDTAYGEIIRSFILQYYTETSFMPREIILEYPFEESRALERILSEKGRRSVVITVPKKGNKKKLLELVKVNGKDYLDKYLKQHRSRQDKYRRIVEELNALIPVGAVERLEAYDISNIYGVYNVGTMVVYENGQKKKNDYRKFKIKSHQRIDDYASMREVLDRRFSRLVDEYSEASFSRWPNLILIDGGKGQVSVVEEVMASYGLKIPVVGMVKDEFHRTRGLVFNNREYSLSGSRELYTFIYEIQEEVHRFAIDYHKTLRFKGMTESFLDEIPGVGRVKKTALLRHFENVAAIKQATLEELQAIPEIDQRTAGNIIKYFAENQ